MWFRRKPPPNVPKAERTAPSWEDNIAGAVARMGIKLQKAFAAHMERWTGKLSPKSLKTALLVFCLLCGGLSGYWIITATLGSNSNALPLAPTSVQTPKLVVKSRDLEGVRDLSADTRLLRRIYSFRRYVDSLQKARGGLLDSMLTRRPGLLDSLNQVEEMYGAQPLK